MIWKQESFGAGQDIVQNITLHHFFSIQLGMLFTGGTEDLAYGVIDHFFFIKRKKGQGRLVGLGDYTFRIYKDHRVSHCSDHLSADLVE